MTFFISNIIDLKVTFASLSGALVYILTQHHFERARQPAIFLVSFIMGITGADTMLEIAKYFIPADFTGERATGAFLCSALVVTITIKLLSYVEMKLSGRGPKAGI